MSTDIAHVLAFRDLARGYHAISDRLNANFNQRAGADAPTLRRLDVEAALINRDLATLAKRLRKAARKLT